MTVSFYSVPAWAWGLVGLGASGNCPSAALKHHSGSGVPVSPCDREHLCPSHWGAEIPKVDSRAVQPWPPKQAEDYKKKKGRQLSATEAKEWRGKDWRAESAWDVAAVTIVVRSSSSWKLITCGAKEGPVQRKQRAPKTGQVNKLLQSKVARQRGVAWHQPAKMYS